MKLNKVALAIFTLALNAGSAHAYTTIHDYLDQSVEGSYLIKSLMETHQVEVIRAEQENQYYLPTFNIDHTTKTHMEDHPDGGIKPYKNRQYESNINLRSNVWRDNHDSVYKMLLAKSDVAGFDVEIEKSNVEAQIKTAVYSIFLYEGLIEQGEDILIKAKQIDADIKRKVKGGLAKASEQTTAEVLINDMDNAILATKLKIKQLKLNLEQVSGVPYPDDMALEPNEIKHLLAKIPLKDIANNKSLRKKALEVQTAQLSVDTNTNWMSVDLYAKTQATNLAYSKFDTEVGVVVTMDLFNPTNYWKEKTSTHQYSSEKYMLDQMHEDLFLSLQSQLSIQESNRKLLDSQQDSISIKQELIKERQDEYQINATSLYELIQAWNGYYVAIQQKTDTEVTLINTMISIDVLTGEI